MSSRAQRTALLKAKPSYISPSDASEIRLLLQRPEGELTHARCPARHSSKPAIIERTIEMFFVIAGRGFLWRSIGDKEDIVELRPARAAIIPEGAKFQYRSVTDLVFMVATLPKWKRKNWREAKGGPWQPGATSASPQKESKPPHGQVMDLKRVPDYVAPDGSEIRLLLEQPQGGLAHCALAAGKISAPVRHRSVSEIWFTLAGHGILWRRDEEGEGLFTELCYGVEIEITPRTAFQFRSTGDRDLEVLLLTMPKFPGPAEAEPIKRGYWRVRAGGTG